MALLGGLYVGLGKKWHVYHQAEPAEVQAWGISAVLEEVRGSGIDTLR
jgi:hypothetical protein